MTIILAHIAQGDIVMNMILSATCAPALIRALVSE